MKRVPLSLVAPMFSAFALVAGAAVACGGDDGGSAFDAGPPGADGSVVVDSGGGGTDSGGIPDIPDGSSSQPDAAPTGPAQVFGHSSDTLYKVDPTTKSVTIVGKMTGCGNSVIDIALDKDSKMVASTSDALYRVDIITGACTLLGKSGAPYPNSLSFVPVGTVDPNREGLVGYNGSEYIQFDPTTGARISSKPNALPSGLASSGDIVSIINGPSYLAVNGSYNGKSCGDCLVEVDPKTGAFKAMWGSIGFPSVWGIAFWAGAVYGFDSAGDLFEVKFPAVPGNPLVSTKIAIPAAPQGLSFYGAGSTTSAPVGDGR
jgi:hypothetical protein